MEIHRIIQSDRKNVDEFIIKHWHTMQMAVRGELIDLGKADGLYVSENSEMTGLVTFRIIGDEMEILSLNSVRENEGTGSGLLKEAERTAKDNGCSRIRLITTNDNINALRFYQKRGFDMVRLYRGAVEASRKLKPEIPLTGDYDIPLRHEIELEKEI